MREKKEKKKSAGFQRKEGIFAGDIKNFEMVTQMMESYLVDFSVIPRSHIILWGLILVL